MALFNSDNQIGILIKTDADNKGIDSTSKALGKLDDHSGKAGMGFGKMTAAVAVGTAAFHLASAGISKAVNFLSTSAKAYQEVQTANAQLEHAVLRVSKATKQQLEQTIALSDELERKGVLDGDNIKMGLAQLSTFGLSNKAVQGLGKSLSDLAVNQFGVNASGEQLSQTANMIAKALNMQFGVLEKSGIRFTDAQKHMIQYGTEMQKVQAINEGFAQNLKFTNDVALTTTEGKLAKLKVSYENVKESIGKLVVEGLTPLMAKASMVLSTIDWEHVIGKTVASLKDFWARVTAVASKISEMAQTIYAFLKPSLDTLFNTIDTKLRPALERLWTQISPVLIPVLKFLAVVLGAALVSAIWVAVNVINVLVQALSHITSVISNVSWWISNFVSHVRNSFGYIPGILRAIGGYLYQTIIDPYIAAWNWIRGLPDRIVDAFRSIPGRIKSAVGNIDITPNIKLPGGIKIPGFASGVQNFGGGLAVVGERGPELVNLPRGSSVIPNHKLGSVNNNRTVTIQNLYLGSPGAVREMFNQLDADTLLAQKGLTPMRGGF